MSAAQNRLKEKSSTFSSLLSEAFGLQEQILSHERFQDAPVLTSRTKTYKEMCEVLCQQLDRDPTHVLDYFKSEMDVEGNFGAEGNVLLQGRHKGPMINGLYKKYVEQYVRCLGCKSIKTEMTRDPSTRLLNLKCKMCDATRTCQNIKKGFHAIRRGERRAARQK